MTKKEKILSLTGVLALALFYIGMGLSMHLLYNRLFPLIFSGIVATLCILGIISEARKPATPPKEKEGGKETWTGYFKVFLWAIALFITVALFGFIYVIPVFIIAYTKTHGTGWVGSIITGVVTGGLIWLVFIQLLNVYLWEGILFGA